jgi:hypothetical protein
MTTSRRRWFRFSLRMMLVAVAILCALLAWERHVISERKRCLDWLEEKQHGYLGWDDNLYSNHPFMRSRLPRWLRSGAPIKTIMPTDQKISWLRVQMGDKWVDSIGLKDASELDRIQRLYPEATIFLPNPGGPPPSEHP